MSEVAALVEGIRSRVIVDDNGCWLYQGCRNDHGYARVRGPQFRREDGSPVQKNYRGHRVMYEALVGPVPEGLVIDHLCRVRHCVNPEHLEPVTRKENLRRGRNHNRDKTHCLKGHPFDEENTYQRSSGRRGCRACQRSWSRQSA